MKLLLLHVSSSHEPWIKEIDALYAKKIAAFFPFEIREIKPKRSARSEAAYKKNAESQALLDELKPDDFVVLFDENGKVFDSREFAKKVEGLLGSSKKRTVFLVGGAFGVNDELKKRAELKVSFSAMTMNHLVARTVALEQIYRSLTIIKNIPYHND